MTVRALEGAKRIGLFGLSIPVRYGGSGLSLPALCPVVERLTRYDRALATTVGLHVGLGVCGLVDFGTDRLKDAWLPRLASGSCLAAFAATEAMAGSDIGSVGTTAVADGNALRVTGSKAYITNAGLAGVFTVLVRTPGLGGFQRGHSMVLVERGGAGFLVGVEERKLGLRGSSTTSLYFDDVRVPIDHVVGRPGRGLDQLAHVLTRGRTVMAAGCCGLAEAALRRTLVHVSSRSQFGRKIGTFDVVRAQVSEMAALHFMMVGLVRRRISGTNAILDRITEFPSTGGLVGQVYRVYRKPVPR